MKQILKLMVMANVLLLGPLAVAQGLEYPDSQDPEVFAAQVERMIVRSVKEALPIIGDEYENRSQLIKEDTRDWESVLEKIANHPEQFGGGASRQALNLAQHRGTFLKSPGIIQGAIKVLQFEKESALKKVDDNMSRAETVNLFTKGNLGSFIANSLDKLKSPDLLKEIIAYFNSEDEAKIGLIKEYPVEEIAAALRDYGDLRHVDEAMKFSAKLRETGRANLADDIDRSVERIRKDTARTQASPTDGTSGKTKDGSVTDNDRGNSNEKPLWPWLAAGGALISALWAYFRLKRAGT